VGKALACLLLAAAGMLLAGAAQAQVPRAFVAAQGSDTNASLNCSLAQPCRTFQAAVGVVNAGGEVVALDSAGFGAVTIGKSVAITAPPGVYASIAVLSGNGVTIATSGVQVTLTGLTIEGPAGNTGASSFGVNMSAGTALNIENCVISNFTVGNGLPGSSSGVNVTTPARVRIAGSVIRNNFFGVYVDAGAQLDVLRTQMLDNFSAGVLVDASTAATTHATVTESLVSNSGWGLAVNPTPTTGNAQLAAFRTTLSANGIGAIAQGANTALTLSECMLAGNKYAYSVALGALESLGNNTIRQNSNLSLEGSLTVVPPM